MTLPSSTSKLDAPVVGSVLAGKYLVESVIGAGGMGVVVAARHQALRQRVAIKFLNPMAKELPGAVERFLREARAAVAIQSEHVARVLDVGTLDTGEPFMVMEYLTGTDLKGVMKSRGPLPVEEAVDLLLQACEAIGEAHSKGIIHRDIKPANLFLTTHADGSPLLKVLDFGLAKVIDIDGQLGEESLTNTSLVAGSASYSSPEQFRSLKGTDSRSDIWSLGVVLFEMLTNERPFPGSGITGVCASVIADTPPSVTEKRPEVPRGLDMVVQECLAKDPERRVQRIADLCGGLAPFASARGKESAEMVARVQGVDLLASGTERTALFSRRSVDSIPGDTGPSGPRPPISRGSEGSTFAGGAVERTVAVPRSRAALMGLAVLVGAGAAFLLFRPSSKSSESAVPEVVPVSAASEPVAASAEGTAHQAVPDVSPAPSPRASERAAASVVASASAVVSARSALAPSAAWSVRPAWSSPPSVTAAPPPPSPPAVDPADRWQ